ncbi:MAG: acetoin utilization protein AcuC [Verrucomicrobia bacterium]|nr:acetoin utilization protein AcuC [Verrucomicrobiota bacterium]
MDRAPAFIYSPALAALSYPTDCPFNISRAKRTRQRILSLGLPCNEVTPTPATQAVLEKFHTPRYLDELQRASAGDLRVEGLHMGLGAPDTPLFHDLWQYAVGAAGASLTAAELILDGKTRAAFTPWGGLHHAMPEKAAGFCYINDVVLACMRLADAGKRVLCLDVDAHHGDGTQAAFYRRNDVMTISLHESGKTLFPWGGFEDELGEGPGLGYNVNIPFPAETYDDAYLLAFDQVASPLLRAYAPDVVVLELGMDALAGDPLTHLRLTNNVFVEILNHLLRLNVPLLVTGGGGYHVENTVRGWTLAWKTLTGDNEHDLSMGMGGVMLESSEWLGGLQDRVLPVSPAQRAVVEPAVRETIAKLKQSVFPLHNLPAN